jgi:uncharacterized protein involved in exopolysaccharide biosynthesis
MPPPNSENAKAAEKMLWQFVRRILLWSGNQRTRYRRYIITFGLPFVFIWVAALGYVVLTPRSYLSEIVLNLPNSSVQSSVSLQNIGQTSINSAAPFANSSVSPIVFYKSLAQRDNVRAAAARNLDLAPEDLSEPKVDLIDQTAIMIIKMKGPTPRAAQERTEAVYRALQAQLDTLRRDEAEGRLRGVRAAIAHVERQLIESSNALQQFQERGSIVSQEQFQLLVRSLEARRQKIAENESDYEKTVAERARLSQILGISPEEASAALRFQADPRYTSLSRSLGDASLAHADNNRKWGANHPQVLASAQRVETIRENLLRLATEVIGDRAEAVLETLLLSDSRDRSELFRSLVELDTKASGLNSALETMRTSLAEFSRLIEGEVSPLAELARLERRHKIAETVFASAMARVDTSGQDIFSSYPLLQAVTAASLPLKPNSPKVLYALGGALLATILLFISMVFVWLRQPFIQKILKSG